MSRPRDARNPQHAEMADESMVRTLSAQAELLWPQEEALFRRYGLSGALRILDVGCGTGEITHRLAALYPQAEVTGVDLLVSHLEQARRRSAGYGPRLRFELGDATALAAGDASHDLVVCRHMVQVVPDATAVVRELVRVTRPGGRLHILAEDYHMLHAEPGARDPDDFWHRGAVAFGAAVGTELRVGRKMLGLLRSAGARAIAVDYLTIDTVRSERETLARMMVAWRDGFAPSIGAETAIDEREAVAHFDEMIATIRDPGRYFVWHVPIWSAVR
ncbi:MAG TPA: methyltransferase domain-containing protein [Thermoanaerobaculia bacterium]|jgi:SAM-dependent methyltransferase